MGKVMIFTAELQTENSKLNAGFNNATKQSQQWANKTKKHTKSVGKDFKKVDSASIKLSKSFKRAANSSAILTGPLNGISGRLSFLASGLASTSVAAVGFTLAIGSAGFALAAAARAAAEYEVQMFRLEAIVKATGGAAGLTAQQMSDLADEVGRNTLASAAGVRDAVGVLATFNTVQNNTFREAIRLSQDMAAVMGTDAKSAALQLGKALEDPLVGLTALKRSGVSFNDTERKKIRLLVESGELFEAQVLILERVKNQVGGAGAAEGAGLSGSVDLLSENWSRLLITVGKTSGVAATSSAVFNQWGIWIGEFNDYLDVTTEEKLGKLAEKFSVVNQRLIFDSDQLSGRAIKALKRQREALRAQINEVNALRKKEAQVSVDAFDASVKKQQGIEDQIRADAAAKREKEVGREFAIQSQKTLIIQQAVLQRQGFHEQAAELRFNKQIVALDAETEKLRENNLLTEEIEVQLRERREALEEQHQQRLVNIRAKSQVSFGDGNTDDQGETNPFLPGATEEGKQGALDLFTAFQEQKFSISGLFQLQEQARAQEHEATLTNVVNIEERRRLKAKLTAEQTKAQSTRSFFSQGFSDLTKHSKKAFKVQQALKISETVQNTYSAAMGAYNALASIPIVGPALGAAAAAAAIAFGSAQVSAIKSQKFGGGAVSTRVPASVGGSGGSGVGSDGSASTGETTFLGGDAENVAPERVVNVYLNDVIDSATARKILEAVNEALGDGATINIEAA